MYESKERLRMKVLKRAGTMNLLRARGKNKALIETLEKEQGVRDRHQRFEAERDRRAEQQLLENFEKINIRTGQKLQKEDSRVWLQRENTERFRVQLNTDICEVWPENCKYFPCNFDTSTLTKPTLKASHWDNDPGFKSVRRQMVTNTDMKLAQRAEQLKAMINQMREKNTSTLTDWAVNYGKPIPKKKVLKAVIGLKPFKGTMPDTD